MRLTLCATEAVRLTPLLDLRPRPCLPRACAGASQGLHREEGDWLVKDGQVSEAHEHGSAEGAKGTERAVFVENLTLTANVVHPTFGNSGARDRHT